MRQYRLPACVNCTLLPACLQASRGCDSCEARLTACCVVTCCVTQCYAACIACLPAGLEELWNNASWQGVVGPDGLSSSSSPVMQAPRVDHEAMQQPGAGAKRGLLEAVLQLSVPPEVGVVVVL